MFFYAIKTRKTDKPIYSGLFPSLRRCVEQAVADGVPLAGADLRGVNLLNARIDGGVFDNADFSGANMTGINASECMMHKCDFSDTTLHGAALCESSLDGSCFDGALFGATDIFSSRIADCLFSTLSAFSLNFPDCATMTGSRFENPCGTSCPMSRPPVSITGLSRDIIIMDRHIKIGHDVFALDQWGVRHGAGTLNPSGLRLRLEQLAAFKCMPSVANLTVGGRQE